MRVSSSAFTSQQSLVTPRDLPAAYARAAIAALTNQGSSESSFEAESVEPLRVAQPSAPLNPELVKLSDTLAKLLKDAPTFWHATYAPTAVDVQRPQTLAGRERLLRQLEKAEGAWKKSPLSTATSLSAGDFMVRSAIHRTFTLAKVFRETRYDLWGSLNVLFSAHDAVQSVSVTTRADVEKTEADLKAFPAFYRQWAQALHVAKVEGWEVPKVVVDSFRERISEEVKQIDEALEQSPYAQGFQTKPEGWDGTQAEWEAAATRLKAAVQGPVREALVSFNQSLNLYRGRDSMGLREVNRAGNRKGSEAYRQLRLLNLDVPTTSLEVRQIAEKAIAKDFQMILPRIREFLPDVSDDEALTAFQALPINQFPSSAEVVKAAAIWRDRVAGFLEKAFGLEPGAFPLPAIVVNNNLSKAAYDSDSNALLINDNPENNPKFDLPSNVAHEMGHWLNAMLRSQGLPELVSLMSSMTSGEGFGMMTERLAALWGQDEAHPNGTVYDAAAFIGEFNPFVDVRAYCDVMIHAYGMSFEEATDFMAKKTGLSADVVKKSVLRFISTPAQVLAYPLGMEKLFQIQAEVAKKADPQHPVEAANTLLARYSGADLGEIDNAVKHWMSS